MSWIDAQYPAAAGRYQITSPTDDDYNCIAFAAGCDTEWWSHQPGYRWPAQRTPLINALVAVFAGLGYENREPSDNAIEAGYDKVALYVKRGMWCHAARQLPSGKWRSKLGPDEDIEHDTPECLCGDGNAYGAVHCIMRKARP